MANYTHMYSQLKQTVGQLDSTSKTMLPMYSFVGGPGAFHSFILGFPFMRCEGYSNGVSLRAGDVMTLRLRNIPQTYIHPPVQLGKCVQQWFCDRSYQFRMAVPVC